MNWIDFAMYALYAGGGCLLGMVGGCFLSKDVDRRGGTLRQGEGTIVGKRHYEARKIPVRLLSGSTLVPTVREVPERWALIIEVDDRIESVDIGPTLYAEVTPEDKITFDYRIGPLSGSLFIYGGTVKIKREKEEQNA